MESNFIKELEVILSKKIIGKVEIYYEDGTGDYITKIYRRDFNYYIRISRHLFYTKNVNYILDFIISDYSNFILGQYLKEGETYV